MSRLSSEDRLVLEEMKRQERKKQEKNLKKQAKKSGERSGSRDDGMQNQTEYRRSRSETNGRQYNTQRNTAKKTEKYASSADEASYLKFKKVDRAAMKQAEKEVLKAQKAEKKQKRQELRERRRRNREITQTTVIFAVAFLAMVVYYAFFVAADSSKIVNNPYNARLKTYAKTVTRGSIYTSGGEEIARTVEGEDGEDVREYPYDELFAHAVGMNSHGKTGIEKLCDYDLLTSSLNPLLKAVNEVKSEKNPGNDVITTLDYSLQAAVNDSLGDNSGAAIVLDTETGRILAMVSKPDYDPNQLEDLWDEIEDDDSQESFLLNRATQGLYTPGSVFKIFTALEYLREHPGEKFSYTCYGSKKFAGYTMECYDGHAHGKEDLKDAFANSCNGAFATAGTTLNPESWKKTLDSMYFNSKLPLNIEYSKSRFSLNADSSVFDITQTSIGQSTTLVTPVHMAMIVEAIANDGQAMRPYIVSEIIGSDGKVLKSYTPDKAKRLMTKEESLALRELMSAVTEYGTGKIFAGSDYTCGGKTGTAQIDTHNNVNSWFAGYGEKGKKKIALSIVIENVADGSTKAVTGAKKIMDAYFDD